MGCFEITTNCADSSARSGLLKTAHGEVETPVFMPVGTRGTIKGILPKDIRETGSKIVLANTYHLFLRPGVEVVEATGGLHRFMAWEGPILTDSGGYQVFSLDSLTRMGDDGVEFASHIDGAKIYLDPRIATEAQNRLGADIIMCFDECAPLPCEKERLRNAVERTVRWAKQCKQAHQRQDQLLFGIVQGGTDASLRSYCAEKLIDIDFPGYAIGGLSVGETHEELVSTTEHTAALLPEEKPRYLMGVGMPEDIVAAVACGIDMFDCVLPTRNGRNAYAFTESGPLRLRNSSHTLDEGPIEAKCDCYTCRNFSRAAIRHFFNVGEMLGPILTSLHNIAFYQRLLAEIRRRIQDHTFGPWARRYRRRETDRQDM